MNDSRTLYALEVARREARRQQAMADAARDLAAWYRDVGKRAERTTNGHAGANYGKVIDTAPLCWCGKATTARGLCENHYSQRWKREHGRISGKRNQKALCHPGAKHHANGLCRKCYEATPEARANRRERKKRWRARRRELREQQQAA